MDGISSLSKSPKGLLFGLIDFGTVILAMITNTVVLIGIFRGNFKLAGYKRFLLSLTLGDLYMCCVNFSVLVFDAIYGYEHENLFWLTLLRAMQFIGFFGNLFNLCCITFDHFIGIITPHKYSIISQKVVVRYATVYLWAMAIVLGLSDVPMAIYIHIRSHPEYHGFPTTHAAMTTVGRPYYYQDYEGFTKANREEDDACVNAITEFANAISGIDSDRFRELYDLMSTYLSNDSSSSSISLKTMTTIATTTKKTKRRSTSRELLPTKQPIKRSLTTILSEKQVDLAGPLPTHSPCFIGNTSRIDKAVRDALNNHVTDPEVTELEPWMEFAVIGICFFCLAFLIISYGKIFMQIHHTTRQSCYPYGQRRKVGKLVVTTCMFVGIFMVCWLPFITFEIAMSFLSDQITLTIEEWSRLHQLQAVFMSLLMSYPLMDSVIYGVRVTAVRRLFLSPSRQRRLTMTATELTCYVQPTSSSA